MIKWNRRSPEIANLLNPAFCAVSLYSTISEFQKKANVGISYPLIYLILPIILHKGTRERVSSKTNMVVWLQRNPDTLVGFAERAKSLVSFTNEALEYLLNYEIVDIENGMVTVSKTISQAKINKYKEIDQEISDCITKSQHVGRWFFQMRAEENIYAAWGVKP